MIRTHRVSEDGVFLPRTISRPDGSRLVAVGNGRWRREWRHADGTWAPHPQDEVHYAPHDDRSDLDDARWLVWTLVAAFAVLAALFAWRLFES